MARSAIAVAFPPSGGQLSLPEQADAFPARSTVLSGAAGRAAGCGGPERYRECQEVERFRAHVGFYDVLYAFQQDVLAGMTRSRGEEHQLQLWI